MVLIFQSPKLIRCHFSISQNATAAPLPLEDVKEKASTVEKRFGDIPPTKLLKCNNTKYKQFVLYTWVSHCSTVIHGQSPKNTQDQELRHHYN